MLMRAKPPNRKLTEDEERCQAKALRVSLDRFSDILSMIVNLSAVAVKRELTLTARATQNRPTGRKSRNVRVASYRPESSLLLLAKC